MSEEPGIYDTAIYKAVDEAGGVPGLAERLGVTRQAVYPWLIQGFVPPARAVQIEELYGIPRRDLIDPNLNRALSKTLNIKARGGDVKYQQRVRRLRKTLVKTDPKMAEKMIDDLC